MEELQIRELVLTKERLSELWVQCQQVPLAWEQDFQNLGSFMKWLDNPRNVFLEIVHSGGKVIGLVFSTEVIANLSAGNVGFIAFDRILKGREATFHRAVDMLFRITTGLRITCLVPESRDVIAKLCHRLGFRYEGKMRRAHRNRDGRVENVDIFGLLVEDLWRFEHQRAGGTRSNGGDVLPGKESVTREIQQDPVDRNMVEPVEAIKLHDDSVAG
jgi:hypothetical protein